MNILHVAPHLGGGVGKAHAALAEARQLSGSVEQHRFILLEPPQDTRFADRVQTAGAEVIVTPDTQDVATLVAEADILQVEWWSHPRLYEFLARTDIPPHRLVLWTHVSGLVPPLIASDLVALADVTAFTSACSFDAENLKPVIAAKPDAFAVANSGFGFAVPKNARHEPDAPLRFGFLGTLDFAKLHPGFFDALDRASHDLAVRLFGTFDPAGNVAAKAAAMRHPHRVSFAGHVADPAHALAGLDVFVYLLSPDHYGTGENALVEAMSLGLCPVVLDNPAERAIVSHQETGLVATSIEDAAGWLDWLVDHPADCRRLGEAASRNVSRTHTPTASLAVFRNLYARAMASPKARRNYAGALGQTPAEWFTASIGGAGIRDGDAALAGHSALFGATAAKGSLAHFRRCFPDDAGLLGLAG